MENSESTVNQLKIIKWLVMFIAASVLIAAGSIAYFSVLAANLAESSLTNSPCGEENFSDKVSNLVDEGKTEEAIKLADDRIKSHPNDEDAYWYRGVAFYLQKKWQPAIEDFNKVEELAPSWKEQYVEPYRTAARAKLGHR